jgi:hypothetical protein
VWEGRGRGEEEEGEEEGEGGEKEEGRGESITREVGGGEEEEGREGKETEKKSGGACVGGCVVACVGFGLVTWGLRGCVSGCCRVVWVASSGGV